MGYKKLSDGQEKQLIEEYTAGTPVKELMAKYGFRTKKSITDKVKKYYPDSYEDIINKAFLNRKQYEYHLNKISSPFDAYLVGLLLTDGYVLSNQDGFGIDLTDEDCIAFLSKTIGKEYKTYYKENTLPRHRLVVYGKNLKEELKRFSIVRNKTYIIGEPLLYEEEKKYLPYIIRGIIDGDGCVSKTSYGGAQFYIVSQSEVFIDWCKKVLEENFYMVDIHKHQGASGIWRIETANQYNILKLIALVYNHPYGMMRKYNELRKTFREYNKDVLLDGDDGIFQTTTEMA